MHILSPVTALQLPEGETKVHVVGPESNSGPLALKSDALKSDRLRYAARHRVHRQGGKQMTMTPHLSTTTKAAIFETWPVFQFKF